ncbi:hypothetical protein A8C56_07665 [Niabella ginsenosidivorans]|uniref:Uncharacterized protein n=1 Tax=Niabella ginsenosidivorans TaxID=1176587 RepID=A0A1A9I2E2_9BACT|nr:hypothetical protein [Niabella ginsenosidivorans]ANH80871.1 hypothetical protein A8C56_07665 [Niabella ginsenosidivorans]
MWAIIISSYYAFNYPQTFKITALIKQAEWKPLLLLYLALLLLALTLAFAISRKGVFTKTFLKAVCILQSAAILFFIIYGLIVLYKINQQYGELIRATEKRAENDIKRDAVTFISDGLPLYDSIDLKRDSIMERYGIHTAFYCTIDNSSEKYNAYYKQLTKAYLNKRNGKGWKERMQKELEAYKRQ